MQKSLLLATPGSGVELNELIVFTVPRELLSWLYFELVLSHLHYQWDLDDSCANLDHCKCCLAESSLTNYYGIVINRQICNSRL